MYTGAPIPAGYKSVAFSLTLRADDQTLTDDHAEETMQSVLKALEETFHATIPLSVPCSERVLRNYLELFSKRVEKWLYRLVFFGIIGTRTCMREGFTWKTQPDGLTRSTTKQK